MVDLTNGAQFAFPPKITQGLAHAKKANLKEIAVSPKGTGLHWPKLDADLTVAGLLAGIFGSHTWMRELASTGGKAVSERKAAATRANGAKGGWLRLGQTTGGKGWALASASSDRRGTEKRKGAYRRINFRKIS